MRASSIDQYALHGEIAAGGMATVHLGRRVGPVGFARTVAVKRLYGQFAREREFVDTFLDEARLAASIHHPNVVPTVDVVAGDNELLLVMEYVHGDSLAGLARATKLRGESIPLPIVLAMVTGALRGLHAAHEARGPNDEPLGIIHRDVSPQNVMVGVDGIARVCDFGIAKAATRQHSTRDGQLKGKLAYMAPERLGNEPSDRRADVYAVGLVLWELLVGRRAFVGDEVGAVMHAVLSAPVAAPSAERPDVPPELDAIVGKAVERSPDARYPTALAMAEAIEAALEVASTQKVGQWVADVASAVLAERRALLAGIEQKQDPVLPAPAPATEEDPTALVAPPAAPSSPHLWRSEVHESPDASARRASRAAPILLGLAAAIAASGIAIAVVALRRSPQATPSTETVLAPALPSGEPAEVLPSASAPSASAPSASAPSASAPSASASAVPAASSRSIRSPARVAPRAVGKANCKPPWVIEPDGTKRYKPECL